MNQILKGKKAKSALLLLLHVLVAGMIVFLSKLPATAGYFEFYWTKIISQSTAFKVIIFGAAGVLLLLDFSYILAPFFPRLFSPITKFFDKINSAPDAAKASFWFVASNLILKGIGFITTPIFTRLLDPSDYGVTSVFISWESVISVFATLSLAGGVYNVAMIKYKDDINTYTSCMMGLTFLSTSVVYAIIVAINLLFPSLFQISTAYLLFMAVQSFSNAMISFWLMRKRFNYDYKSVLRFTISNAIISPACAIIAILLFPNGKAYAKIIGAGVYAIVIGIIILMISLKRGKKVFHNEYYRFALKFNLPLIPHYLSSTILYSSDKIMINNMINPAQAGLYSISYSINGIVSIVTQAINQSLIPFTLKSIKENRFGKLRNVTTGCTLLVAGVCVIVSLFAQEMVQIFATEEYVAAAAFVPPLSYSVLISFVSGLLGNILFYYEKTWYMTLFTSISAAANLLLNFFCIQWFGAIAASYTTLFSTVLSFVLFYFTDKKYEKNLNQIFDMRWILVIFAAFGLVTVFSVVFYNNLSFRIGLVAVVLIAAIILHKKIVSLIKQIRNK